MSVGSDSVEPIKWTYIKRLCNECDLYNTDLSPDDVFERTRSVEVIEKYREWKLNTKDSWLYNNLFDDNTEIVQIRENDFPYLFESSVVHYVVWLRPGQEQYQYGPRMDTELLEWVREKIYSDYGNVDFVHFRNEINLRTVPTIDHYHVVVNLMKD